MKYDDDGIFEPEPGVLARIKKINKVKLVKAALFILVAAAGLTYFIIDNKRPNKATLEFDANPWLGFDWECAIQPEGIVRLESKTFVRDSSLPGMWGKYVFKFKSLRWIL